MEEMPPINTRPPDPFVAARVIDPKVPPTGTFTVSGLLGDSDREGRRRLYLNTKLDFWVEFLIEDVAAVESVAPDQPPFVGLDATRVTLAQDATLDWTRRQAGRADPFLLEARDAITHPPRLTTWGADCPAVTHRFGESDFFQCEPGGGHPGGGTGTLGPWPTQGGHTCATCNQGTCVTCDQTTCVTCVTCDCPTVAGTCGRATCWGCTQDCDPHGGWGVSAGATCDRTCASCNGTCDASCGGTCRQTCDNTCATTCQETCMDTCFTCAGTCQATCETCWTCHQTCGTCRTDPGWCLARP